MPTIYDNIEHHLLADLRQELAAGTSADVCVGYFNLRGWDHLADAVDAWPGWMQALATFSPVTYALQGIRDCLLDCRATSDLWPIIWPLLIMGAITPPLGIWVFQRAERFVKRTGRLKRNG